MEAQVHMQPSIQLPLHKFSRSQAILQSLSNFSQILSNNKTLNQSIENVIKNIENVQVNDNIVLNVEDQWNFLFLLRILFYVLVFFKLIQLLCSKKKKMDIKERVYRKFYFSHGEVLREFDQDDKRLMDITLSNTIKNAYVQKPSSSHKKRTISKSVVFHQQKNQYYQPQSQFDQYQLRVQQQIKQNELIHMKLLQAIRPMCKQPEEQFEIVQIINDNQNQNRQLDNQQTKNTQRDDSNTQTNQQQLRNKVQSIEKQKTS